MSERDERADRGEEPWLDKDPDVEPGEWHDRSFP